MSEDQSTVKLKSKRIFKLQNHFATKTFPHVKYLICIYTWYIISKQTAKGREFYTEESHKTFQEVHI